jgi:hypothetical protein
MVYKIIQQSKNKLISDPLQKKLNIVQLLNNLVINY